MSRLEPASRRRTPACRMMIALALCFLALGPGVQAGDGDGPYEALICFGDSFSDTGNLFLGTEGRIPPEPLFDGGRFSNGKLWVEHVAAALGLRADPWLADGTNYAVIGSFIGVDQEPLPDTILPSMATQVEEYLAEKDPGEEDLFVVFGGHNELRELTGEDEETQEEIVCGMVDDMLEILDTLAAAGAKTILVPSLANLGLTPEAIAAGTEDEIERLARNFNATLASALDDATDGFPLDFDEDDVLACTLSSVDLDGVELLSLDTFAFTEDAVKNGEDYGFENVDQASIELLCDSPGYDPAVSLFYDCLHPTARAHRFFGRLALEVVAPSVEFVRGDADADEEVDLADILSLLEYMYEADGPRLCTDAHDMNDDGAITIVDPFLLIDHLYGSGADLPEPQGSCGADESDDFLSCVAQTACGE